MPGADEAEKASLMSAVSALGRDARAIMPDGMALEIQKVTADGAGGHHLAMVEWADRSQSKLILGQVLSAEARNTGLGSGVADFQAEVRRDILIADARSLAATLTRDLVYPLLALNRGGVESLRRCPRFEFDLGEAEDLALFAQALPALAAGGAQIPVAWVHEKLRIPEATDGEPVFGAQGSVAGDRGSGSPVAPPDQGAAALAALAARGDLAFPDQQALDDAMAGLADGEMTAQARQMILPLLARIRTAKSPEALLGELAEAYPEMDSAALEQRLERLIFAAMVWGRLSAEEELDG